MSETSVVAILASVGIFLAGSVTADASALASAVQQGTPEALENFVYQFPDSTLAPDALWLAAEASYDKPSASATSSENPDLTCSLNISRTSDGKATVTWTMTGASKAFIEPLGYKKGSSIPQKGSKSISVDGYTMVTLIAQDAKGNTVKCTVVLGTGDPSRAAPSVGTGGPTALSVT